MDYGTEQTSVYFRFCNIIMSVCLDSHVHVREIKGVSIAKLSPWCGFRFPSYGGYLSRNELSRQIKMGVSSITLTPYGRHFVTGNSTIGATA